MAAKNPFKPTAGDRPPLLIGRDDMRQDFAESIENGPGAPGLLSIFTGPRGIGKTVMLGEIEDEAIEHGWIVISETATAGLVDRIGSAVRTAAEELGDGPAGRRVTGVTLGILRVDTQLPAAREVHWRRQITELLEKLGEQDTGLLISIDEIHAMDRTELSEIAAVVQHLIRESLPIGLVLAGLPKSVEDLLNEGVSTFLRRAEKYDLHRTSIDEVAEAFRDTFSESGVSISDEHLRQLAEATGGYPFLIQLVGYHVWSQARKSGAVVTDEALAAAYRKPAVAWVPPSCSLPTRPFQMSISRTCWPWLKTMARPAPPQLRSVWVSTPYTAANTGFGYWLLGSSKQQAGATSISPSRHSANSSATHPLMNFGCSTPNTKSHAVALRPEGVSRFTGAYGDESERARLSMPCTTTSGLTRLITTTVSTMDSHSGPRSCVCSGARHVSDLHV